MFPKGNSGNVTESRNFVEFSGKTQPPIPGPYRKIGQSVTVMTVRKCQSLRQKRDSKESERGDVTEKYCKKQFSLSVLQLMTCSLSV